MSNLFQKYFIVWDIIFAVLLLIIIGRFKQKFFIEKYKSALGKRIVLSEKDFCMRLPVDENNSSFVQVIRENLAKRLYVNPSLIYPEDKLWRGFDFEIIEVFDKSTKEYFYENYEYFSDDVKCVGDLVKFLIQVRADAKLEDPK